MKQPDNLQQAGMHRGPGHVDYRETEDITREHGAIAREHSVGTPGGVPVPMWLIAISLVAVFWAGAYFGMFSGGFSSSGFDEMGGVARGPAPGMGSSTGGTAAVQTPAEKGKRLFAQNCVQCHQGTGLGIPGQYPPLAKSEFVNGGSKRVIGILLKGLQGPVKVEGAQFNGAMPAWEKQLTDDKIANILTYVRSEWGNSAPEITPEQVGAGRKEFASRADPWNEGDLLAIPPDAQFEGGKSAAGGDQANAAAPAVGGEQKK